MKPLYSISKYLIYLFINLLICFFVAIIVFDNIYPLNIIKNIVIKAFQLTNIFFLRYV